MICLSLCYCCLCMVVHNLLSTVCEQFFISWVFVFLPFSWNIHATVWSLFFLWVFCFCFCLADSLACLLCVTLVFALFFIDFTSQCTGFCCCCFFDSFSCLLEVLMERHFAELYSEIMKVRMGFWRWRGLVEIPLFAVHFFFFFFILMSNILIYRFYVMSTLCMSCQPDVLCSKSFDVGHYMQAFQPNFFHTCYAL